MKLSKLSILIVILSIFISCSSKEPTGASTGSGTKTEPPKEKTITYSTILQYGDTPSIDVDSNGVPHISFVDVNESKVKYAYISGTAWNIKDVEYIPTMHTFSRVSGISVDSQNLPHIVYNYLDTSNGVVSFYKYAKLVGQSFQITSINMPKDPSNSNNDCYPDYCSSISVNKTTSEPNIALSLEAGSGYSLGFFKSGYTNAVIIAPTTFPIVYDAGRKNKITLDTLGNPHICYIEKNLSDDNFYLKYAYYNGSAWNYETIDLVDAVWTYTPIELDNNNVPHVAYMNDKLYHAYKNGSTWIKEIVVDASWEEPNLTFSLDNLGKPHFIFEDSLGSLYYKYWDGTAWQTKTISTEVCGLNAIKVDRQSGKVHIVYVEGVSNFYLKYALVE